MSEYLRPLVYRRGASWWVSVPWAPRLEYGPYASSTAAHDAAQTLKVQRDRMIASRHA